MLLLEYFVWFQITDIICSLYTIDMLFLLKQYAHKDTYSFGWYILKCYYFNAIMIWKLYEIIKTCFLKPYRNHIKWIVHTDANIHKRNLPNSAVKNWNIRWWMIHTNQFNFIEQFILSQAVFSLTKDVMNCRRTQRSVLETTI